MTSLDTGLYAALAERGISRRAFLKFAAAMTGALALPASYAPRVAAAVANAPRLPVIWLRGQTCSGNSEAFLRSADPTVSELVLSLMSVEYDEMLMASSGSAAVLSRTDAMAKYPNGYIAVVEGGIPTADGGTACTIGGRAFVDIVREVCGSAEATIAVGSCAFDGGTPGASGGSTGSVGVSDVIAGDRLINLPGCPLNVSNLTATIVHFLTFRQMPVTDGRRRPLFAYGGLIHNQCERRAHFEFGEFALAWGDEASQKGWCLYKVGCKGPETFANCPTAKYAEGTSWPVKAGHGCIGCTMPHFWDAMGSPYQRIPVPLAFIPNLTADTVGQVLVGGVAAVTMAHGTASYVRSRRAGGAERKARAAERKAAEAERRGALEAAAAIPRSVATAPVNGVDVPVEGPSFVSGSLGSPASNVSAGATGATLAAGSTGSTGSTSTSGPTGPVTSTRPTGTTTEGPKPPPPAAASDPEVR